MSVNIMFLIVILLFLVILVVHNVYQFERRFGHLRKAFPNSVWTFLKFAHKLTNPDNSLYVAKKLSEEYKTTCVLCAYPTCKLIVNDPKLTELILNTNMNKTYEYSFIKSWLKTGILTSDYEKWKKQRKLITPAFHTHNLQQHIDVFIEMTEVLIEKLSKQVDKSSIDITPYIILCSLDAILATALGAYVNIQDNTSADYINSIHAMRNVLYYRTFTLQQYDLIYRWSALKRHEKQASEVLNKFSMKFIEERQKSSRTTNTILDNLLENEEMSDENILEEINTIIFAGHDTTGLTFSFCLYELSKNQEIQEKVYHEILEKIGEDGIPTSCNLEELTYMTMVLKEVTRLYPAVPVFTRRITRDIQWNNVTIPKGVNAYFIPYAIHRNAEVFPEPEKFDPERFNAENASKIQSGAYFPFSSRPRSCIGRKYALMEMKIMLIYLLRRFKFLPAIPEHKLFLVGKVTLQSNTGIKLRIVPR